MSNETIAPTRKVRKARQPRVQIDASATEQPAAAAPERKPSKLDQVQDLLLRNGGATIAEIVHATGWQQHSVRGAMAGALKKRGLTISSDKIDGVRRYRAEQPA